MSALPLDVPAAVVARDLPAYRALYEGLTAEIVQIQAQLGDRDRRDADGARLEGHDFWQWRRRAGYALAAKIRQKRALKLLLHEAEMLVRAQGTQAAGPIANLPIFCLGMQQRAITLADMLRSLRETLPPDDDLADLAECLLENLDELRAALPAVGETGRWGSARRLRAVYPPSAEATP